MIRFFLSLCLIFCLCNCRDTQPVVRLPSTEVQVVRNTTHDLAALGRYVRAVKLETSQDSLLGVISAVKLDAVTGDILVGDYRVNKTVLRFSKDGAFKGRIGGKGQGPGEYHEIQGFTPTPDGGVVILGATDLLRYDAAGKMTDKTSLRMAANWVEAHGEYLYVRAIRGPQAGNHAVVVFDKDLEEVTKFHPRDKLLDDMAYIPLNPLARMGDRIFASEVYDFQATAYDLQGKPLTTWRFPNANDQLKKYLKNPRKMKQEDMKGYFGGMHRARSIYAVNSRLYMLEVKAGERIMRSSILNPDTNVFTIYENLKLANPDPSEDYLTMSALVGSYDKGLIGYVEDPERLQTHRDKHPVLADVAFEATENPVILFFEIDPAPPRS